MLRKEWTIDSQLTSKINIPGLTIVDNVETKADYYGIYQFEDMPHCSCGCEGHFDGFYKPVTIWHILDDDQLGRVDHPKIITIEIQKRRYRCSGCSKIIPYKQDVTPNGALTTAELNNYIGRQCLDRSPKKVAADVGLRKTTVENIFAKWAAEQLREYESKLIAPKELGFHLITIKDVRYYLVTDIQGGLIVDIFQKDNFAGMVNCLTRLAKNERTTDALTEFDRNCVAIVRGVFCSGRTAVRAAVASVSRTIANDIISEMDQRYTGRGKKAIGAWLLTPLLNDLPIEPEVSRIRRQGSRGKNGWLCSALNSYHVFRNMALQSWDYRAFDDWFSNFKLKCFTPPNLSDALSFAKEVFANSFGHKNEVLQKSYINTESQATDIILRNQKCSFDLMRDRLLLKCNPKIVPYGKTKDTATYYYRGVSLMELAATLQDYEE